MEDEDLLRRIRTREALVAEGYKWVQCKSCKGLGSNFSGCGALQCFKCGDKGGHWEAPITK